jgi:NDP-sugar pyrophosphorylase family protein
MPLECLKKRRRSASLRAARKGPRDFVDIDALIETHKSMGRLATVTAVHPSSRLGELAIDGGMITSFAEKPQVAQGWVNGGYFVFNRRAFEELDYALTLMGRIRSKQGVASNVGPCLKVK